jgi:rhodanese-related sulfurtransferase
MRCKIVSDSDKVLTIIRKYWLVLVKWLLRIHDYPEITVDQLYQRFCSDALPLLIDVRSLEEYEGTGTSKYGHIQGAMSIPMLELETKLEELAEHNDQEIVTICQGGGLSLAAVDVMKKAGFKNVKSLKGGSDLWHRKGYPMTSG